MKKIILSVSLFISCISGSFAQIPNWSWESWTKYTKIAPDQWNTSGKIDKITPGANGGLAVKIQASTGELGGLYIGKTDGSQFWGGLPFAARPDSFVFYCNYDVVSGDEAMVLISFQKKGLRISNDIYKITNSSSNDFQRISFKINYHDLSMPDTVFIGFTSTNPVNPDINSYLIIDNVSFTNTSLKILNADFEKWTESSFENPDEWSTFNTFGSVNSFKSNDAYSGNYALRLQTTISNTDTIPGYLVSAWPPYASPWTWGPSFALKTKPDSMMFYAKFFPENNDSALINISIFKNGNEIGYGFINIAGQYNKYTPFNFPIIYDSASKVMPDSAIIGISTYNSVAPLGASVIYIDNMSFDRFVPAGIRKELPNAEMDIYPNPVHSNLNIVLNNKEDVNAEIQVTDINGRIIFSENVKINGVTMDLNLSALNESGIYFIRVITANTIYTKKIIKY